MFIWVSDYNKHSVVHKRQSTKHFSHMNIFLHLFLKLNNEETRKRGCYLMGILFQHSQKTPSWRIQTEVIVQIIAMFFRNVKPS